MAALTEDMKAMVAGLRLCYVATVTPEGKPNLSPKGSLKVLDDQHLAFADIMSPQTMRNLKANPAIEVNMVDPFLRRGYRFKGTCEIHREGAVFDSVANELWVREGRQYPVNAVVRIKVEQALPVKSPAYVFNKGVQETDVRRIWLERYGVVEK
ncbi:MAG TPA: pyridoxamine 5'-phosphate oxidase family protein [Burkholderiales bacterium]|nr:pyridoxamine 5'-phosphate oxidase family protein [Burkholderiales bacterium]